jgi:hypothetical protein
MVQGGVFDPCSPEDPDGDCTGERSLVVFNGSTARKLTVFVFAYTCAQNIFPICNELKDFSVARTDVGPNPAALGCMHESA